MKLSSTNPSRSYKVIGEVEMTTEKELTEATAKARAAQPAWAMLSQSERNSFEKSFMDLRHTHADEIATLMSTEMGKPIAAAKAQIAEALKLFVTDLEIAEKDLHKREVPRRDAGDHTQW